MSLKANVEEKITKYARPAVLILLAVSLAVLTLASGFETYNPTQETLNVFLTLAAVVFGFYYAGRTLEKMNDRREARKEVEAEKTLQKVGEDKIPNES